MNPISLSSAQEPGSIAQKGAAQPGTTTEEHVRNRSLAAAANAVNEAGYAGNGREVHLSVDKATREPVITVVDTSTNQVVYQWPQEYLLELAAGITKQTRDSG